MRIRSLEHAKGYCSEVEKIENFEKAKLDNFKGWHCNDNRVRCQCIETGIIYESFSEASRQTGQNVGSIRKSCLGIVNPRKFHWRFI